MKNHPTLTNGLTWRASDVFDGTQTEFVLTASSSVTMDSAAYLTNGVYQFNISGGAGSSCLVEVSTNLVQWLPLQTNSPYTGTVTVSDTEATNSPQRFYRVSLSP